MGADVQTTALVPEVLPPAGVPAVPVAAPRIAPKKRAFCHAFKSSYNVVKAVAEAGIITLPGIPTSDPQRLGQLLLEDQSVRDYLRWLDSRAAADYRPPVGRIRDELVAVAFSDLGDAMEFGPADAEGYRPLKRIRVDKMDTRCISSMKVRKGAGNEQEIEIKLHPKIEATKMLATEAGMLSEFAQTPPSIHYHVHLGDK